MNPIVKLRASAQPPPLEATQPATYSKGERGSTVLSVVVAPVNSNVALWMSPSSVDKLWFSDSLKHQCNISKPGTQNLTLTLPDKSVKYNVKLWYWLCLQALNKIRYGPTLTSTGLFQTTLVMLALKLRQRLLQNPSVCWNH